MLIRRLSGHSYVWNSRAPPTKNIDASFCPAIIYRYYCYCTSWNISGRGWWRVRVTRDARFRAKGEWLYMVEGVGSRRHYAKEMVSSVIPGSRWPEVVAFGTSCGIVSARLSASNGRARASRASKSDGCSALLKRISYIFQARSPSGPSRIVPRYGVRSWVDTRSI